MSTKPTVAQTGGKASSHAACEADPAPAQPESHAIDNYHDSAKSELQPVPAGTAGDDDGAETGMSRLVADHKQRPRRVSFTLPPAADEAGDQHKEQDQWVAARHRRSWPSDVPPPSQRRSEQPPLALGFSFAGPGGLPLPPPGSTYVRDDGAGAAPPRREAVLRLSSARTLTSDESLSTLARPRARRPQFLSLEHREALAALWFTACCLLFWLLALAIGFALLVVYLRYHRLQPPRMHVTAASLLKTNSSSSGSLGEQAEANYSLTIHADIYNPNTKLLQVVLRYVPLDLYFNGSLIGTGAVWPVLPFHEAPGDSSSVQLLGSVTQEKDVASTTLWRKHKAMHHNDGAGGVPLELRLVGMFRAQLNIGRWIPSSFRFWVYSTCTLWLDPPPGGALRRSRCLPEYT